MEDFTATWGPYCPRATAVLENLAHQYPDTFIGIAVHASGDPMYCTAYGPSSTYGVSGLPTVLVGRRIERPGRALVTSEQLFGPQRLSWHFVVPRFLYQVGHPCSRHCLQSCRHHGRRHRMGHPRFGQYADGRRRNADAPHNAAQYRWLYGDTRQIEATRHRAFDRYPYQSNRQRCQMRHYRYSGNGHRRGVGAEAAGRGGTLYSQRTANHSTAKGREHREIQRRTCRKTSGRIKKGMPVG